MTTTTFEAIRDKVIQVLEALTPNVVQGAGRHFRRAPDRRAPLREWATANPAACFRKFEFVRSGPKIPPGVIDPSAIRRIMAATLTIAYPSKMPALYGRADLDDMEDVLDADARQLHDAVLSGSNYLDGQHAAIPTVLPPDRSGDAVWFQDIEVELQFFEPATIT